MTTKNRAATERTNTTAPTIHKVLALKSKNDIRSYWSTLESAESKLETRNESDAISFANMIGAYCTRCYFAILDGPAPENGPTVADRIKAFYSVTGLTTKDRAEITLRQYVVIFDALETDDKLVETWRGFKSNDDAVKSLPAAYKNGAYAFSTFCSAYKNGRVDADGIVYKTKDDVGKSTKTVAKVAAADKAKMRRTMVAHVADDDKVGRIRYRTLAALSAEDRAAAIRFLSAMADDKFAAAVDKAMPTE